jgi:uncharacterized protein YcfJ
MKRSLIALVAVTAISAQAQIVTRDVAQVTGVTPIMEQVRQPGQCRQVQSQQQQQGANVGMSVIGGLIGGAVGSRIGQGDGRDAAIAAGAGLGAVWGAGQPQAAQYRQECDQDVMTERVRGYRVTYNYQGYQGSTTLSYQPGDTIPVVINVTADTQGQPQQQQQGYQQQNYQQQQGYQQQQQRAPQYQGRYQPPQNEAQRF